MKTKFESRVEMSMARYVYRCNACKQNFEIEKSMSRSGVAEPCPACQKTAERVFTAPGIAVKGSLIKTPCESHETGGECADGCCDGHCALN